jgi:hypothetical protein
MTAEALRDLSDEALAKMADLVRDWQNKVNAELLARASKRN